MEKDSLQVFFDGFTKNTAEKSTVLKIKMKRKNLFCSKLIQIISRIRRFVQKSLILPL